MSDLLIHRAEVDGNLVDVRLSGDRIAAVARSLPAEHSDDVLDAGCGALIPGLHDHHIHLMAFAAARQSVAAGPPHVVNQEDLVTALQRASRTARPHQWLRGIGYHESVAGELDRYWLDRILPNRPARIQHRSGAMWILNSAAADAVGLDASTEAGVERDADGTPTGRLYRLDDWLKGRIPLDSPDVAAAAAELLAYGVTGLTDATPTERADDIAFLATAVADGRIPQRLIITGGLALSREANPELERGPVKLVIADHDLPGLDDLTDAIATAHRQDRAVAIHCVTRPALLLALAAWDTVGPHPGDRVEHAAVAGPDEAARLAAHRITVVTQPGFVAARGDAYLRDVDAEDQPHLWPCATLIHHGVAVGASSDAPFGPADPWVAIVAAANRRTATGQVVGAHDRIGPKQALAMFLTPPHQPGGSPRRVATGQPADLCLLRLPLAEALERPDSSNVAATIRQGVLHKR